MANDKSLKVKNGLSAKRYMQGAGTATALTNTAGPADAFSTDLYQGTSANQTITNGIDLSTDGGLVWIKGRPNTGYSHNLFDTERGVNRRLSSNESSGDTTYTNSLTSFNNNGFSLGSDPNGEANFSGSTYVAWTFKQQSSFFDIVEYTGNATAGHTVNHNLGSVPGCIIVKKKNSTGNWIVYHRANTSAPETERLQLNTTSGTTDDNTSWNDTAPTSTQFTVGTNGATNGSGDTYVAYLFAHDTSDDGYIQCGNYTGNQSATGPTIDLGWEPQWVLIRNASGGGHWVIVDTERGTDKTLYPSSNVQENGIIAGDTYITTSSTGFQITSGNVVVNQSGEEHIYIAIRSSSTSYSQTIDLSTGHYFSVTMSNPTTFSFTNPPASGVATSFVIELNNNESAITWPSSVKWAGGEAPAATSTKDVYKFITTDGGTTYYGALSGGAMA